ncbi:hypothetical protein [Gordonia neofelifaecis]|nr:hypothetical protein [Gordonia neofelifaecis]
MGDAPTDQAEGGSSAKDVAEAVLAVPGVAALDSGPFGAVATYLPGERVNGVRISPEDASVHIVVDLRYDLRRVADTAAAAAADVLGRPFVVVIEDVTTEPSAPGTEHERTAE